MGRRGHYPKNDVAGRNLMTLCVISQYPPFSENVICCLKYHRLSHHLLSPVPVAENCKASTVPDNALEIGT